MCLGSSLIQYPDNSHQSLQRRILCRDALMGLIYICFPSISCTALWQLNGCLYLCVNCVLFDGQAHSGMCPKNTLSGPMGVSPNEEPSSLPNSSVIYVGLPKYYVQDTTQSGLLGISQYERFISLRTIYPLLGEKYNILSKIIAAHWYYVKKPWHFHSNVIVL